MSSVYQNIIKSITNGDKLLAVLIDPDKVQLNQLKRSIGKINASQATHIFVGGSLVEDNKTDLVVIEIKQHSNLPVILFPGDVTQISQSANALLFLSLISGHNPDYLIGKHVEAVKNLRGSKLEIIPTGYILIENGNETAVQRVTGTMPIMRSNIQKITDTAKAGELLGLKLIYLEAGSGAIHPIPMEIIKAVKQDLKVPVIVGGGIKSKSQLDSAYQAGGDMVVIGTAFEEDEDVFNTFK
ncbi:geranylgeranylglyceryl/heptaprenylglyceryl phosphate synthase [Paucihalobacter sp.]|uniref:geranylgeranylglyceryl/heptaprenylglyceryl phosphate synthase n=1 Tax=Paucihalobacter sp. TaxID=2850405 RepID=UPI002FE251D0